MDILKHLLLLINKECLQNEKNYNNIGTGAGYTHCFAFDPEGFKVKR